MSKDKMNNAINVNLLNTLKINCYCSILHDMMYADGVSFEQW